MSDVLEVEANAQTELVPGFVHEQEIPELTVLVFGRWQLGIVRFEPVRRVHELPEVEPLGDLHDLVDAEAVGNDGAQLGPAVVELVDALAAVAGIE